MGNRVVLLLAGVALAIVLVVALRTQTDSGAPDAPSHNPERPPDEAPPLDPEDLFVADDETESPEPETGPAPEGSAAVVVTVVDESDAPFPGVRVLAAARGPHLKVTGVTGADGTCRLEGLPTNLDVVVTATAGLTYLPKSERLRLDEEKDTAVRLVLTEVGAVEGKLVDESGSPIPGKHRITVGPPGPNLPAGVQVRRGRRGRSYTGFAVDGAFTVRGVRPGKYVANCDATGFEQGSSEQFEVYRGELASGVMITLGRGGSVSGVVVRMKSGEPVSGAAVSLGPKGAFSGVRNLVVTSGAGVRLGSHLSGKTDDQGRFHIVGVKAGTYSLSVTADQLAPGTIEEVVVTKDQETGGILVSLGEGGAITGTVFGPDGSPVPGAEVLYSKQDSRIRIVGNFGQKATTNEQGVYFIDHLEPGDYNVRRSQGGNGGAMSVSIMVAGGTSGSSSSARDPDAITVHEGQVTRFDIRTDQRCAIRGTLTDAGGKPVRKMVQLRDEAQTRAAGGSPTRINIPRTTFPNAKGEFAFESLEPGEYVVTVEGLTERVNISGGETRRVEFRLDSAKIEGVVRNDRGAPVKGARVNLQRLRDDSRSPAFNFSISTGDTTDEEGRYRLDGVQPGTYKVMATRGGAAGESREFSVSSGETVTGIEVMLGSPVRVQIEVRDSGGNPRSGMSVSLFRTGGRPHGSTTGENGIAVFQLTPGRYQVFVRTGTTSVRFMPNEIVVGPGASQVFIVQPR